MALLNVAASRPVPMWTIVRLLAAQSGAVPTTLARALLQPSSLPSAEANEDTFADAITSLAELDLVKQSDEELMLARPLADLQPDDSARFFDHLRAAILDPARNTEIADNDSQVGPRDLVRGLCWLLSLEPDRGVTGSQHDDGYFESLMQVTTEAGHFDPRAGRPIVNGTRWTRFTAWAPALGFASSDAIRTEGRAERLIPDCTAAVRRTILHKWQPGTRVPITHLVEGVRADLPVLPGGRYSRALGLPADPDHVGPSLSFALLCGHDQGWVTLDHRSDATNSLGVSDQDNASGARRVSHVTIQEDING